MGLRAWKEWFIEVLNLFERRRSYKNFVESYVRSRRDLLDHFQSQKEISEDNAHLAEEISFYLNESKKLLRQGELHDALFFAIQAERRLFSLFQDTDDFAKITNLKKEWYRSYLRDYIKLVPAEEQTETLALVKKGDLTSDEWRTVVNRSTKIRLVKLDNHFKEEMKYDKIVLHLFYFSLFTSVSLLIIVLLAVCSGNNLLEFTSSASPDVLNGTATTTETGVVNATSNNTGVENVTAENPASTGSASQSSPRDLLLYLLILTAGGLGALVNGLLSKRETDLKKTLDAKELEDWMNVSRVFLGAASGLIVAVLVSSEFINISVNGATTVQVLFVAAIAAGFSDQLLTSALQRVSIGDRDADTPGTGNPVASPLSTDPDTSDDPVLAGQELTRQVKAVGTIRVSSQKGNSNETEENGSNDAEDSNNRDQHDANDAHDSNSNSKMKISDMFTKLLTSINRVYRDMALSEDEDSQENSSGDAGDPEDLEDLETEDMGTEETDLEDLYVEEQELNRQAVAAALLPYIGIDRQSGKMRSKRRFDNLGLSRQVVVRLLYKQAAVHLGHLDRDEIGEKPKQIANELNKSKRRDEDAITKSEVQEAIDHWDFIEYDQFRGGYYIPAYRVDEATERLPNP